MKKKLLSAVLILAIAASALAACAMPAVQPAADAAAGEAAEEAVEAAGEAAVEAVEETAAEAAGDEEVVEITLMMLDRGGCGDNDQKIIDALNAITEPSIGVKIKDISWGSMGDYGTQVGLALAANESYDVMMAFARGASAFPVMYAQGSLMDITEYAEEFAPEALEAVGDYMKSYSVDGRIYGFPTYRNFASQGYIVMRQDILDELGLTEKAENMTTFSEMEEIGKEVSEKKGITAFASGVDIMKTVFATDDFTSAIPFDDLGDTFRLLYTDRDGNVSCLLENEDYKAQQAITKRWYDEGLIYKDLLTSTDVPDTYMQNGSVFGYCIHSELGIESAKEQTTGRDLFCKQISNLMQTTSMTQTAGMCVPKSAAEPEAAVKWINALYTNPEMMNILTWGIEGEDYIVEDGMARYPDGVDANSVEWHQADFIFGNQFLLWPWTGSSADLRELAYQSMLDGEKSPYLGFTANQTGIENVVAALSATYDQYGNQIRYGAFTDEIWDEYLSKAKAQGLDEYIGAYQEQLDTWRAAN